MPLISCLVVIFNVKAGISFPSLTTLVITPTSATPTATPTKWSFTLGGGLQNLLNLSSIHGGDPWHPHDCVCVTPWDTLLFMGFPQSPQGGTVLTALRPSRDFCRGPITNAQRSNTSRSLYPSFFFFFLMVWVRSQALFWHDRRNRAFN